MAKVKHLQYIIVMAAVALGTSCRKEQANDIEPPVLEDTTHHQFKVGQKWRYTTRPHEPGSTLTILKIEAYEGEVIVHIAVSGLLMSSPGDAKPKDNIGHLPVAAYILESSVTTLAEKSVPLPDFKGGYRIWRKDFDKGQAGYFTAPVSKCVEVIEKGLNKGVRTL